MSTHRVPPPQQNYQQAADRAMDAVRKQSPNQMTWLGADYTDDQWSLPVLDDVLTVDLENGKSLTSAGEQTGPWWLILTLHYLAITDRPESKTPDITFAELPAARAYAPVFQQRVIARLCHTVGRERETLLQAGEKLGDRVESVGDIAFDFRVFPQIALRLIWYGGDDELGPSATLLLPNNIESYFCIEDIVVLSERLVSRLSGGRF